MKVYLRFRRAVDVVLGRTPHHDELFAVTVIPPVIAFLAVPGWLKVPAVIVAALPMGFLLWRGWRLMKTSSVLGDRAYDRQTKHILSKEYRDTEGATATARGKLKKDG